MKLLAALSGGVDSSVAAALAVEAGHQVVGVTLGMKHPDPAFSESQLCANKNDREAVIQVTQKLGIEHHFVERYPEFRDRVLEPSAAAYLRGETPNPCCICNQRLKFATLFELAREWGADGVLTGHYARIDRTDADFPRLLRGSDPAKDQTYFLYRLGRTELQRLHFPVGELEKPQVRAIAERLGLVTAKKPDSQDACFQVPGECFGETLRRLFDLPSRPGRFLYRGKTVGRHRGIHQFTIGQRKGLNVALGVPAYVVRLNPETGDVELETDPAALLSQTFTVNDLVLQSVAEIPERVEVQVRYRSRPVPATVKRRADGILEVRLDEPFRAITPGQSAVFYDAAALLGGGIIRPFSAGE